MISLPQQEKTLWSSSNVYMDNRSPSPTFTGLAKVPIAQASRLHNFEHGLAQSKKSREDYFYSLYQNAKKTIQNAEVNSTESSRSQIEPQEFSPSSSSRDARLLSRLSPSFPTDAPEISNKSSTEARQQPFSRYSPKLPFSTYVPPSDLVCKSGACHWPFALDKCHGCRIQELSYQMSNNSSYNQKAFFNNEYYLRQKEKWRRPRTVYTEKQLASLEKAYKKNKYLRGQERKELCKTLSLEERHIKVWYQNRRAKERGKIRHDRWLQRTKRHQQRQDQKEERKDC